ncbi:MAG: hypothetical protein LBU57_00205 [Dysgonamonadaceae bacterium]|jgi:hypothetical protein|nr:hypothetical protein [Dysgonamonadaceae bacterium]
MKRTLILLAILTLFPEIYSQQVDLENINNHFSKGNLLKMSGGFSANSVCYSGNEPYGRDPFTYYLNGTVNFNIMNAINMPFSFNFTNSGSNYTYPSMPNRFSLHPGYKWLTGHFGDVSMNFSPYTLNGHLFTGAGVEVKPADFPLKVSAMYGRLQRAVEYGEGNPNAPVSYRRMGSGAKIRYEKPDYRFGASIFGAKDDEHSLEWAPDSLSVFPEENLAISVDGEFRLADKLRVTAEYGVSLLKRDIRRNDHPDMKFHAVRGSMDYTFKNNTIGIGYERIDPGYKTLGAYYFNNDLENITLNYARPFLKNKGSLALSGGIEHDNLKKEKDSQTRRFISSAHVSYAHSEALNFDFTYSGFQTYLNIRSQFDYINELTPYDHLDTLNYTQISQSVALAANYVMKKDEIRIHLLNVNLSLQEAADKQGDVVPEGGRTVFCNASLAYGLQYLPKQMTSNLSINVSTSRMSAQDVLILGPTFNIGVPFFDKKVKTAFIASYNMDYMEGERQSSVWNLRLNADYTFLKKHRFSIHTTYRDVESKKNNKNPYTHGLTFTAAYNYHF